MPRFFTERSFLRLVYAKLVRAAALWQRIMISRLDHQQLDVLRRALGLGPTAELTTATIAVA